LLGEFLTNKEAQQEEALHDFRQSDILPTLFSRTERFPSFVGFASSRQNTDAKSYSLEPFSGLKETYAGVDPSGALR